MNSNKFIGNSIFRFCKGFCILLLLLLITYPAKAHEGHKQKIKMYTKKIKNDPYNPENYYLRGVQYQSHGDFNEARADLFKVLALNPEHKYADYNLALLYYDQVLLDSAMIFSRNFLRKAPDDFKAYNVQGIILNKKKQYLSASQAFEQAISKAPNPSIDLYYAQSENYKDAGYIDKARQSLLSAIEKLGPIIPLRETLIELEISENNWDIAHAMIDDLIGEMKRKEVWYIMKADVFKLQGKKEDAKSYYILAQEAIDMLKPNLRRKKNIKKLEAKISSNITSKK